MKTDLLYLKNTYLFNETAKFMEMRENEKGKAVILDRTIFYPQGGGQPTDTGHINSNNGVFKVKFVGLDHDGIVWHFGEFESGTFADKENVTLEIDKEKRKLHARIHSAGHLIDCVLQNMNVSIKPDKGFHFVDGSYIEGDGELDDKETFKVHLERKVNELVRQGLALNKEELSECEAKEKGIEAPPGKNVRIVGFEGYDPCGCGGTHVSESKDIGHITIRKVSSKKGRVKISYSVA